MTERHEIPVTAEESVVAVHHEADSEDWLVCCHGFRSDMTGHHERRCERAAEEGYNAVRFDCRGCGESDGEFVEQTLSTRLADLAAVVSHFDPPSYVLLGSSFGGKVAVHAAADDDRVAAVAAQSPAAYDMDMGDRRAIIEEEGEYRYDSGHVVDERLYEDLERYDFSDAAAEIDVPVAMFHGADDEKIPVWHSLEAAAELEPDVLLQTLPGEGHVLTDAGEERLLDQLFDWLRVVRGGRSA
jgi:pimeloyl-ACP methyl ester carboxylesterase